MQHIASFIESAVESQQQHHNPILVKSDLPTQVSIIPAIPSSALPSIFSNISYDAVEHFAGSSPLPQGPGTSSSSSFTTHMQQPTLQHRHQARAKFPMNAFMLWSHERRRQISEQNPSMHPTEVFKHLGNEWRKMGPAEKKPYSEKAKRLWQQYKIDNPDYKLQFSKGKKAAAAAPQQPHLSSQSSMHSRVMINHSIPPRISGAKAPSPAKRTLAMGEALGGAGHSSQPRNASGFSGGDESAPLGDMVSSTHRNLRNQGLIREAAQFKKYVLDLVSNYDFIMLEQRNG